MDKSGSPKENWGPESPELADFRGPHVAVDIALFTVTEGEFTRDYRLAFLLHKRQSGLATGEWALPGRMVRERERLQEAVEIALNEKCGISGIKPTQLYVFDEPTRDLRGWVMSIAYRTTQKEDVVREAIERNSTLALGYVQSTARLKLELPDGQKVLPFGQDEIVEKGVKALRRRYKSRPDPDLLLGRVFTMYQLRKIHEAVAGEEMDKDLFRRRMEGKLQATEEFSSGSVGKPAQLFKRQSRSA